LLDLWCEGKACPVPHCPSVQQGQPVPTGPDPLTHGQQAVSPPSGAFLPQSCVRTGRHSCRDLIQGGPAVTPFLPLPGLVTYDVSHECGLHTHPQSLTPLPLANCPHLPAGLGRATGMAGAWRVSTVKPVAQRSSFAPWLAVRCGAATFCCCKGRVP
jgi:hypothetical protein